MIRAILTLFLTTFLIGSLLGIVIHFQEIAHPAQGPPIQTVEKLNEDNLRHQIYAAILLQGKTLIGTPYLWGGEDPSHGVDCSGFLSVSARRAGFPIHRTTTRRMEQNYVETEPFKGAFPLFSNKGKVSHVGIWDQPNIRMVHASSSKGVELRAIDTQGGYWRKRYLKTVRHPLY